MSGFRGVSLVRERDCQASRFRFTSLNLMHATHHGQVIQISSCRAASAT